MKAVRKLLNVHFCEGNGLAKELISIMEERKLTDEEDTDWYRITDAIGYYVCANYDIPMVAETVISIYDNETNEPFVESLEPFIYY